MSPQSPNKRTCRILAADDDEEILQLYKEAFSLNKKFSCAIEKFEPNFQGKKTSEAPETITFEPVYAKTRFDAVEKVKTSIDENDPFSIAFLDIRMPLPEDGLSTGEKIRKLDANIEIVFVTGFFDYDPIDIASRIPPVHKLLYIQKPFSIHELLHFAYALSCKWLYEENGRLLRDSLIEMNSALKVLLSQRENDQKELGETIHSNIQQLVTPNLEKLKSSKINNIQRNIILTLESNFKEITSPLVDGLGIKAYNLTPMELQTANYVKSGLSNKEIAEILGVSDGTIMTHRHKIREKLGLKNKKVNLRSHLLSMG